MGTPAIRDHVLLMTDQLETLLSLVKALETKGYQVIVVLTFCDALAWLEVGTPRCVILHLPTLTATDIAVLRASHWWAKQVPLVVVTSVPIPAALRPALEGRAFSVVPLCAPPDVLCHTVTTFASQEEAP